MSKFFLSKISIDNRLLLTAMVLLGTLPRANSYSMESPFTSLENLETEFGADEEGEEEFPLNVKSREKLRTDVKDELLHLLEKEYLELLKKSPNATQLLKAEALLHQTNNNTHWTNYSAATKILKANRDKAAIPLLLRYIVIHSKRSARHVMIPEYRKTITYLTGEPMKELYRSGPNTEERMREKVLDLVNNWWLKKKDELVVSPKKMSTDQLRVVVDRLVQRVTRDGDFSGSGGRKDTAYRAYHVMNYRIVERSTRTSIAPLLPEMVELLLEPNGFGGKEDEAIAESGFPYAKIWILSELAKSTSAHLIAKIASDTEENSTVRMLCSLALFRAGREFPAENMLSMLKTETHLQKRLILLLSLQWADEKEALPVLLEAMKDPNIEIATAAACALPSSNPPEAIPQLKKLIQRRNNVSPILLLNRLAKYESSQVRAILHKMLSDAVDGKSGLDVSRVMSAFLDSCNYSGWDFRKNGVSDKEQARMAMARYEEQLKLQENQARKLASLVKSLKVQIEVAEEIEALRRKEYKRLLALQGDEVVTAKESEAAYVLLQSVVKEVAAARRKYSEAKAKLDSVEEWTRPSPF